MVSHPELGSDPPIGSDRESGCDIFCLSVVSLYIEVPTASLETLRFLVSNGSLFNRGVRTPLEHVVVQPSFRL